MPKTPEWLQPFWSALHDLLALLQSAQAPHLIIGGVAASLVGEPRATQDLDALSLLDVEAWPAFYRKIAAHGFEARMPNALAFLQQRRILLLRHRFSGLRIDIAFGALPFEVEACDRVRLVQIDDLSIPLPTPEDLIIMKAVAHRPQDAGDVCKLISLYPDLDQRRIRTWVRQFAEALEMPEIYDDVDRTLKAALPRPRRRKTPPTPRSRRR